MLKISLTKKPNTDSHAHADMKFSLYYLLQLKVQISMSNPVLDDSISNILQTYRLLRNEIIDFAIFEMILPHRKTYWVVEFAKSKLIKTDSRYESVSV